MLPKTKNSISKEESAKFTKQGVKVMKLCIRFYDNWFIELNTNLIDRIIKGRTLKNKQKIVENFYTTH